MRELRGPYHSLIHLLRFIMVPTGKGVLDRDWEVRSVFGATYWDPYLQDMGRGDGTIFPEYGEGGPFLVSGTRLVERAALIAEAEIEVVRLSPESPDGFDLMIYEDTGHPLVVHTSDGELYLRIEKYFASTSGPEFADCFV